MKLLVTDHFSPHEILMQSICKSYLQQIQLIKFSTRFKTLMPLMWNGAFCFPYLLCFESPFCTNI